MSKFKWGPNFLDLNAEVLNLYKNCKNAQEIIETQTKYMARIDEENSKRREQSIDLPPSNSSSDELEWSSVWLPLSLNFIRQ